jgi:hypothetical protein
MMILLRMNRRRAAARFTLPLRDLSLSALQSGSGAI